MKKKLVISFSIPIVILLLMVIMPLATLLMGEEVLIKTKPCDPRDLFMGDYVILNYEISDISPSKFEDGLLEEKGYSSKDVYVVLKKSGRYHEVDYVSAHRPTGSLYLKAAAYIGDNMGGEPAIHVEYNLDRYFVPENTGKDLEEQSRLGNLTARIKVLHGYSLVTGVSFDD